MGFSGILNNTLVNPVATLKDSKHHWRWVYISSFCMTVNIYVNFLSPDRALEDRRSEALDVPIPSTIAMLIGGVLVGLGSRIGNGCTTGHGICGIGRFSPRSLVATATFTACSMATRYLISPLRSWAGATGILRTENLPSVSPLASALVMAATCIATIVRPMAANKTTKGDDDKADAADDTSLADSRKSIGAAISGVAFAIGLAVSGMTKNSKVHDFLCFSGLSQNTFDPTLMAVMGSGIISSWLSYQFIQGWSQTMKDKAPLSCPLALPKGSKFGIPTNRTIDARLVTGAMIFGMGWGLTGVCPGPGLYAAAAGVVDVIMAWMPGYLVGSHAGKKLLEFMNSEKKQKTA